MKNEVAKLHRAFEKSRLTLEELGGMTGVHFSTISKAFKRGTASKKTLRGLEAALEPWLKKGAA